MIIGFWTLPQLLDSFKSTPKLIRGFAQNLGVPPTFYNTPVILQNNQKKLTNFRFQTAELDGDKLE